MRVACPCARGRRGPFRAAAVAWSRRAVGRRCNDCAWRTRDRPDRTSSPSRPARWRMARTQPVSSGGRSVRRAGRETHRGPADRGRGARSSFADRRACQRIGRWSDLRHVPAPWPDRSAPVSARRRRSSARRASQRVRQRSRHAQIGCARSRQASVGRGEKFRASRLLDV